MQVLVANGVTSILNLFGTPSMLALRERVARGEVVGPKLIRTSGRYISDAPHSQPEADEVVVHGGRAETCGQPTRSKTMATSRAGRSTGWSSWRGASGFKSSGMRRATWASGRCSKRAWTRLRMPRSSSTPTSSSTHRPGMLEADPETRRRFLERAEARIPELARATASAGVWGGAEPGGLQDDPREAST